MAADILIKALGLNTSPNALNVPEGSLIEASNVIIQRDNVVQSRRGYKLYGTELPSTTDRTNQLLVYKGRILRHYNTTLQFDTQESNLDDESIFSTFTRQFTKTGDTTITSQTILNINTEDLSIGLTISGTGIPVSTTITAIDINEITISNPASATTSDVLLTFSGDILLSEVEEGRRIRSVESNGNTYITSAEGIRKISITRASELTTAANLVTKAGGVKATGINGKMVVELGEVTGYLIQDSAVAYRAVWGIVDANKNTILGTPSERLVIYNSLYELIAQDFMRMLLSVDNVAGNPGGAAINVYGYLFANKVTSTDTAITLRNKLINFAAQIDDDIYPGVVGTSLSSAVWSGGIVTLTFTADPSTISAGDYVTVASVAPSGFNGTYQVQTVNHVGFTLTYNLTTNPGTYVAGTGTVKKVRYSAITQPDEPSTLATNDQLVSIQEYLEAIISELQGEGIANITAGNLSTFITPLAITTSASVSVTIEIPQDITLNHFVQLYRSDISQATQQTVLSDLVPNDEMKQVYEAFPSAAQIAAQSITIVDNVPDAFRGANLYTNPSTGQGILQANDIPPIAIDVARFQNVVFYGNTKTRERLLLNMLGTSNFLAGGITSLSPANPTVVTTDAIHELTTGDIVYINGTNSTPNVSGLYKITVTGPTTFTVPVNVTIAGTTGYWTNSMIAIVSETSSNLYKFIRGVAQVTSVTCIADSGNSLNGDYWLLNSANNETEYYVWYKTSGGATTDPAPADKIGIRVDVVTGDSATTVALKTRDAIAARVLDFTTSSSLAVLTIINNNQGVAAFAVDVNTTFTISTTTIGRGEDLANQEVLLSSADSPAIALDETSRSFCRNINANDAEICYCYYLSGISDVPGKMLLEGRALSSPEFYAISSSSETGDSFDPTLTPTETDSISNTLDNPTVVTTISPHSLVSADTVIIAFSNSTPSISGVHLVTYLSATTFSIPVNVTIAGTTGLFQKASNAVSSDNEVKPNRLYYSKLQEPEAVPLVNYIEIGAGDKAIIRIFALRSSLFVFKEDGLYRVSGDTAPFVLDLFDESVTLIAPDSLGLVDNQIIGWMNRGIQPVSEAGVDPTPLSRPIDVDITKLSSSNYPNFAQTTWGIGYHSDNSYTVYTNTKQDDTNATIGYRYSTLTQSWTTIDKETTCGVINNADDKMYLGAGDTNYIEQERKTFSRLDYTDREFSTELLAGYYYNSGATIKLPSISNLSAGDVLVQEQTISVSDFNALLSKLDLDPGVGKVTITSIGTGSTPTITTTLGTKTLGHNLVVGNTVVLSATNSTPTIDGSYEVLTTPSSTTFTVATPVMVVGTSGFAKLSYLESTPLSGGDDLRTALVTLADRLDTDPSTALSNYVDLISNKTGTITAISAQNPTILTSASHELVDGRIVDLTGTNSTPTIDGRYSVSVVSANTFSVDKSVVISGSTGSFVTVLTDFRDQQASYNALIENLNIDSGSSFTNYSTITTTTSVEAVMTSVNIFTGEITLSQSLDYLQGEMTIYRAIPTSITYAPLTMGDVLGFKHLREATMMFSNKAFSNAVLSFATDLQPEFLQQPFPGDGPGLFGSGTFGSGYFGGGSNSAPFRTIVPRQCQRCRYLLIQFQHQVAREQYAIFGITVVGEVGLSSRAYR